MSIIRLKSNEEEIFEVDVKVAKMSETIETMLENLGSADDGEVIPMSKLNSQIMRLVIDWATYHVEHPAEIGKEDSSDSEDEFSEHRSDNIDPWDKEFLKPLDPATLFELLKASNYLHVRGLVSVTAKTIANLFKGKSPQEIREVLNVSDPESDNNVSCGNDVSR